MPVSSAGAPLPDFLPSIYSIGLVDICKTNVPAQIFHTGASLTIGGYEQYQRKKNVNSIHLDL